MTINKPKAPKEWEPKLDMGGNVQICVRYRHENGRTVFASVNLRTYLELYDSNVLKWQIDGTERPEFNPTRQWAQKRLEQEKESPLFPKAWSLALDESLSARSAPAPVRRRVVAKEEDEQEEFDLPEDDADEPDRSQADLESDAHTLYVKMIRELANTTAWKLGNYGKRVALLAANLEKKTWMVASFLGRYPELKAKVEVQVKTSAPEPKTVLSSAEGARALLQIPNVALGPSDRDARVERFTQLSARDKAIVEAYLEGRTLKGLTNHSMYTRVSAICTRLDLPKGRGVRRSELLRKIWTSYNEKYSPKPPK